MRAFTHVDATTVEEVASILREHKGKAKAVAGGTDLLGQMKDEILAKYPQTIVNLKSIPGLDYIREDGSALRIGALTRLEDIAQHKIVKDRYGALAEAAHRAASPHIREMGTIAGNICQSNRCWYYWTPDNRFPCIRKGGQVCYAIVGENRDLHSIFGAVRVVDPPCTSNCPAEIDIASYLSKIRDGELREAAEILLSSNPFPAITGRVCPHYCERDCNRGDFDEPISIKSIERFVGDYILENAGKLMGPPHGEKKKSVAIVGSGPAGLSAAYYLRKFGYAVTVFERLERPGGWLTHGISPFRLSKDLVKKQVKVLEDSGIRFNLGVEIGKDKSMQELTQGFDAIFLAWGAWKERLLRVDGENLMMSGLEFLRNVNRGVREAPGKEAAIIGGGNGSLDVARTLLRMGVKPVIVYRRVEAYMPAVKEEIEKAKEEGLRFEFLAQPVGASQKGGKITLTCVRTKLGDLDQTGRPRPILQKGTEFTMAFDAVIKAIGADPDLSFLPAEFLDESGKGLKIDRARYYLGGKVFAGGDLVTGPGTVAQAIGGGRKAASAIDRYLKGTEAQAEERDEPGRKVPERFNSACLRRMSRVETPELSLSERMKGMDIDEVLGLSQGDAEAEANRCFNCGCVAVSPSDLAPALIALNAKIKTSERTLEAEDFFAVGVDNSTVLADDEIVTEIQIPRRRNGLRSKFIKFAPRKSIDFPVVNCAAAIESEGGVVKAARICLNAVFNVPYRVTEAEKLIIGKSVDESTAEAAASAAVTDACPLTKNTYKVQVSKALVKRTILACTSSEVASNSQG